jgi:hypothetical protein
MLAKACSLVLHPLLMPLIGAAILLYAPTYISILPGSFKIHILSVFALCTLIFPLFALALMKSLRIIPDLSLQSRRYRTLPLVATMVGYTVCFFLLSRYRILGFFPQLLIGGVVVLLICLVVNLFWKISLHLAGIGGLVGMLLYMALGGYGRMNAILLLFILLAGTLGTARLYLGHHNLAQVLAGFGCGVGVMWGLLLLF